MSILVILSLLFVYFYYSGINNSEDPRIPTAKEYYRNYKTSVDNNDRDMALAYLDSVQHVFLSFPDYENSYETGIILNDRASILLNTAIYDSVKQEIKNDLLEMARNELLACISIYNKWLKEYGSLSFEELYDRFSVIYRGIDDNPGRVERIINKRVKDIILAQLETKRRMSVSYTNLGVIQRHRQNIEEAVNSYKKAIELWDDNYMAENNLLVLMGKDPRKRSFFQKLFPPEKDSKE